MKTTQTKHSPTKGYDRIDRIADLMHRSIAKLLREELNDPRVGWVTIASVEVSRDLRHAKIFVTIYEEARVKETLTILNQASGFFRSQLAQLMHLRVVPRPRFVFDESVVRGARIESLLGKSQSEQQDHEL
jgi:ribosome-binding factor A